MICNLCGGTESYTQDGIEYCRECSMQFMGSQEEGAADESFSRRTLLSSPDVKKSITIKEKKNCYAPWTTIEAYNIILSKQVSALIKLGCSHNLNTVVLHIWAQYLRKCQLAFRIDWRADKDLPRLSAFAKMRDVQLLYGDGTLGRKLKKKKSISKQKKGKNSALQEPENNSSMEEESSLSMGDSVSVKIEKSEPINDSEFTDDTDVDDPNTSSVESTITNSSVSITAKIEKQNVCNPASFIKKLKQKKKRNKKGLETEETCVETMTITKTLSFCHLGLIYTNNQMLLSDLNRLVNEGKIPYIDITKQFPLSMQLQLGDYACFTRCSTQDIKKTSLMSAKLFDFLKLPKFKHPSLLPIVARFVKDLNLPSDVISAAKCLIDTYKKETEEWYTTKNYGFKYYPIPSYEVQAMAFIVVALKMILVLDGVFEIDHSEVMEKINAIQEKKLFIWKEWKQQAELKEYLFLKGGDNCDNLSYIDSLCADRIIGNYPFASLKSELYESASQETKNAESTRRVTKDLLESFIDIKVVKENPTSFPLTYETHRFMTGWKKLPMFKETEEIDFRFISKDFSSHKLVFVPGAEGSNSKELIECLLSSLYESTIVVNSIFTTPSYQKLFKTSRCYWHGTHSHRNFNKKEKWLDDLPPPFKWLLKFLRKYLQIDVVDLYIEIKSIEQKLFLY